MAAKTNIRSIRFSDELAELIDRQQGQTFTQKFENLITRCVWELPQREKQLQQIQERIRQEQERLFQLQKASEELRMLERDIQSRLDRYSRDEDITDVWIWAEKRSDGSYDLYIGYA